MQRRIPGVQLHRRVWVLIAAVFLVVSGCESAPESSGPPPSPYAAGDHLKMNGEKDGVVVPVLNVWNTVPPSEAVCTLQHGAAASVTDTKYNPADKHWWAKIDSGAGCTGWVPDTSLRK